jgi:hypothetical protein
METPINNWKNFEDRIPEIEKWGDNHQRRLSEMNKGCFDAKQEKGDQAIVAIIILLFMVLAAALIGMMQ